MLTILRLHSQCYTFSFKILKEEFGHRKLEHLKDIII